MPIQETGQLKFVEHPFLKEENKDKWTSHPPVIPTALFTQNMRVRFVSGHTESMMLPQLQYKGRTIVYMADLLPSAGHVPLPYVMAYDMFPLTTINEKTSFLMEAQQNDYVLFFEHDPKIECCTLHLTEKGIRLKESFDLKSL